MLVCLVSVHRLVLLIPLAWFGLNDGEYSLYPLLMVGHLLSGIFVLYLFRAMTINNANALPSKRAVVS